VEAERRSQLHKDRVAKLELETITDHDSRLVDRHVHAKQIGDLQIQLESVVNLNKVLEEKLKTLEQEHKLMKTSLTNELNVSSECRIQLENLERTHQDTLKSLKTEKNLTRQLQDSLEILKLDRERDALQFEEKIRRINSSSGESKQALLSTESKLTELTSQFYQQKNAKDELKLNLQNVEERCEQIKLEVKRLQDLVNSFPLCLTFYFL
jgi:hypothetical protein